MVLLEDILLQVPKTLLLRERQSVPLLILKVQLIRLKLAIQLVVIRLKLAIQLVVIRLKLAIQLVVIRLKLAIHLLVIQLQIPSLVLSLLLISSLRLPHSLVSQEIPHL
jgi:hypothetical protein